MFGLLGIEYGRREIQLNRLCDSVQLSKCLLHNHWELRFPGHTLNILSLLPYVLPDMWDGSPYC